jgi:acid phosphatase
MLPPILDNPSFKKNGLLIITFDESWDTDFRHGGGHIMTILAGPMVKKNFQSTTFYQHESIVRLISDVLAMPAPGAGASAPDMSEFLINPGQFSRATRSQN